MKLKYEFVLGDPHNNFLYVSYWGDDKEKSVEMCLHEVDPLQNANGKNEVINVADIRHRQRRFERRVDPMFRKRNLNFFSNRLVTSKYQRPRTQERTPGIPQNLDDLEVNEFSDVFGTIAETLPSTEDDQAEQHDHGTIDKVLGDSDMERGGDDLEEADREVDQPDRIPLTDHSESRPCTFDHEMGTDVFEIMESASKHSSILVAVCMCVANVQVWVDRKSERSSPSFQTRLQAFVCDRPCRAGWPKLARYDQGTHDRDVLNSIPADNGVMIRPAGLGIPEQIKDGSHQRCARFRKRIEGHGSRRMPATIL